MEKIVSLCKRRGFVYLGSEIYGGLANTFDFGPLGVELINNIKKSWWKNFVHNRDDMYGLDGGILMNPKVWEASGHTSGFIDVLVECKKCHKRFRIDYLDGSKKCPECEGELTEPKKFVPMFKTFIGPVEDSSATAYLRPETAQAIFVNFKKKCSCGTKGADRFSLVHCKMCLGTVLYHEQPVTHGNFHNPVHLTTLAIKMDWDYSFGFLCNQAFKF